MNETVILHQRGRDELFKIWHASPRAMLILIHSDGGSIVCREKSYALQKGALCFVGAGKLHYTMPEHPERYDRSKIFFSPDLIPKLAEFLPEDPSLGNFASESLFYRQLGPKEAEEAERIFREMAKAEGSPHAARIRLTGCLQLLTFLSEPDTEQQGRPSDFMSAAMEYINDRIRRELTVDEICAAAHISKYHFCRKFKERTGMTVMTYVLKTRIVNAKNLLAKTDLSVTEISEACGFSSVSYFSRSFREEEGLSPLAYRKANRT